jgi:hypothetical protein
MGIPDKKADNFDGLNIIKSKPNAAVMGFGELAVFLSVFSKRVTAYQNPNSQPCVRPAWA